MAKLPIGTKVFVIETGELGFVIDYYPDFTAAVNIEGELVKVHETGIIAAKEFGVFYKKEEKKVEESKVNFLTVKGISIVFQAVKNITGSTIRFDVFLINNSDSDLLYFYEYFSANTLRHKFRKEIKQGSFTLLHEFKTDHLNDLPAIKISCWRKTAEQASEIAFQKEIKLRAKQFFTKLESVDFNKTGLLVYEVASEIGSKKIQPAEKTEVDVFREYAKKKLAAEKNQRNHIVVQKAIMPDAIDLHIEKLEKNYQKLSNSEILNIQLSNCRDFVAKAISNKLERIYVIHGLGKGVLKNAVEEVLKEYPEIVSYNNNYHPRFGFGATEILLQ
ncbi:MAG: Smr/MutS family protein [Chitinophagales bacterium]